jgi:hypothetical protein
MSDAEWEWPRAGRVPLCQVGDTVLYGTEHVAAIYRLRPGDAIRFRGSIEAVKKIQHYDGGMLLTFSGRRIFEWDWDEIQIDAARKGEG